MSDKRLSSKERALLEAARREVGAKGPPAPQAPAPRTPPAAAGRPGPRVPASSLDAPTVLGWDNPAAQAGAAQNPDERKWARIAAMLERERREGAARRQRARRNGYAVAAVLALILMIIFARALLR